MNSRRLLSACVFPKQQATVSVDSLRYVWASVACYELRVRTAVE